MVNAVSWYWEGTVVKLFSFFGFFGFLRVLVDYAFTLYGRFLFLHGRFLFLLSSNGCTMSSSIPWYRFEGATLSNDIYFRVLSSFGAHRSMFYRTVDQGVIVFSFDFVPFVCSGRGDNRSDGVFGGLAPNFCEWSHGRRQQNVRRHGCGKGL